MGSVLLVAALGGAAEAQQSRWARTVISPLRDAPGSAILRWSADSLRIRIAGEVEQSIAVGISDPGDYAVLADESEIYLAGRGAAGTGRLVALRFDGRRYAVAWTHDEPDGDYLGVAYSAASRRLYVLDGVDREIRCASYAPGGAAPSDWSTVADAGSVPVFAGDGPLDEYGLSLFEDGVEPTIRIVPVGRRLLEIHTLRHGRSGVQVSTYRSPPIDPARIDGVLAPGARSVRAVAPAGAVVTLHRMDRAGAPVIASGTAGPTGEVGLACATGLEWGAVYGARTERQSEPVGPFRTPQLTIGVADPFPGYAVLPFGNLGMHTWLNHSRFAVPLVLASIGAPTGMAATHDVMLNVGVLGRSNVHILPDGRRLLEPLASARTTITLGTERAAARVDLPIGGDPDLAGVVLLFQWVIVADAEAHDFRLSEIAGVLVRSAPWLPPGAADVFTALTDDAGTPVSNASAAPTPRSGARQIRAVREHLRALGFGVPAVSEFREFLDRAR